jgi:hypothetical protein
LSRVHSSVTEHPASHATNRNKGHQKPIGRSSAWTLFSVLVCGAGVSLAAYENVDPDLFWHRVLGAHWLAVRSLDLKPDPIAYTHGRSWFPTAWSVEVLYDLIVRSVGYDGIFVLRFLLAVAFYAIFAVYLFRRATPPIAALVLLCIGLPACLALQDRPQTFSLVFVAALLSPVTRALFEDRLPALGYVAGATWLWANIHGLWVLIPGLLALLTIARLAERVPTWRTSAVAFIVSLVGASLTPVGPKLLLSVFLVRNSTRYIQEWAPTALTNPVAWGLASAIGFVLVGWSRGVVSRPRVALYLISVGTFGLMAVRNAIVAGLLLAPVVLDAISRAFPHLRSSITVPRWLVPATASVMTFVAAMVFVLHAGLAGGQPIRIAEQLAKTRVPLKIVTPYNTTGYVREFGGAKLRLSIDGRADRYGAAEIKRQNDLANARAGWRKTLRQLNPDRLIVDRTSPLAALAEQDGWSPIMRGNGFLLLANPRS